MAGRFLEGLAAAHHPGAHTTDQTQAVSRGKILVPALTHGALGAVQCLHSRQVGLAAPRWASQRPAGTGVVHAVPVAGRRAVGSAVLPDLTQLAAQLLTSHGPVVLDVVTELHDVALDLKLVLLQPRHVEFLPGGTALELTGNVLVVVTDDTVEMR